MKTLYYEALKICVHCMLLMRNIKLTIEDSGRETDKEDSEQRFWIGDAAFSLE